MSRLQCRCNRCDHAGNRSTFYKDRPGGIPSFTDVCPVCQSDNVEVIDTEARAMANRALSTSNWKGNSRAA